MEKTDYIAMIIMLSLLGTLLFLNHYQPPVDFKEWHSKAECLENC